MLEQCALGENVLPENHQRARQNLSSGFATKPDSFMNMDLDEQYWQLICY